jgi:hypothetical protein
MCCTIGRCYHHCVRLRKSGEEWLPFRFVRKSSSSRQSYSDEVIGRDAKMGAHIESYDIRTTNAPPILLRESPRTPLPYYCERAHVLAHEPAEQERASVV